MSIAESVEKFESFQVRSLVALSRMADQDLNGASNGAENDTKDGTEAAEDRKLFIGGLSWETREAQLKEYFEKFGPVDTVNLKMNPLTGKSRCFAFIVFKNAADVDKVVAAGEHAINSKKVDVKRAKAKPGKIFVGGLKPELTDDMLREFFGNYGKITEFEMPIDKTTKVRKGFGFITFEREDTMKDLITKKRVTIGEHTVDLRKATPKPDKMSQGGGGWGGSAMGMGFGGPDYYGYGAFNGFDYYGGAGGYGMGGYNYYDGGYGAGGYRGAQGGGKMRGRGGPKRGGAPY